MTTETAGLRGRMTFAMQYHGKTSPDGDLEVASEPGRLRPRRSPLAPESGISIRTGQPDGGDRKPGRWRARIRLVSLRVLTWLGTVVTVVLAGVLTWMITTLISR